MSRTKILLAMVLTLCIPKQVSADELPQQVIINQVEFIHIPAGEFWHSVLDGRLTEQNHLPYAHREVKVWQEGFYMAKYEARARDFLRFMESSARTQEHEIHYESGATKGCAVRLDGGDYFLTRP
jgi:formylglycine-generating enzyme required for sulfatase activity